MSSSVDGVTAQAGPAPRFPGGLVGLLAERAAARPATALRYKRRGLWHSLSWQELHEQVLHTATGLRTLGAGPGVPVALVGDVGPGWVVVDLAVQALGGRSVALAAQTPADTTVRVLARCGVRLVVTGTHEQAAPVLAAEPELGPLPVVVLEPGAGGRADERVRTLDAVRAAAGPAGPAEVDGGAAIVTVFSDGTDDDPRPVDLPATAVAELAARSAEWLDVRAGDRILSVLSPATPAARVLDLYVPLVTGAELLLPESPATVPVDLAEAGPTVLCVSPRALELLREASVGRAHRTTGVRRRAYDRAMAALDARLDRVPAARTPAGAPRRRGPGYAAVGRWVARDLGLWRIRRIVVTGGRVPAPVLRFFWSLGAPVLPVYGGAEVAGLGLAPEGLVTDGTTGGPLPGAQAGLDEHSALRLRTPVTTPAWSGTGDVAEEVGTGGYRVRGPLAGRIGLVHPAEVEAALCTSNHIRRALVVPDGHGLAAVVEVDVEVTGRWAAQHGLAYSTMRSLVTAPAVRALLEAEVAAAAPDVGRVVLCEQPLTVEGGELTPLLAVRRPVVAALLGEHGQHGQHGA